MNNNGKYFFIVVSLSKSTHHPTNKKPRYLRGLMVFLNFILHLTRIGTLTRLGTTLHPEDQIIL